MIKQTKNFIGEAKLELKKVTWPSKEEIKASTIIVIFLTGLIGLYIGVVDFFLSNLMKLIIR